MILVIISKSNYLMRVITNKINQKISKLFNQNLLTEKFLKSFKMKMVKIVLDHKKIYLAWKILSKANAKVLKIRFKTWLERL